VLVLLVLAAVLFAAWGCGRKAPSAIEEPPPMAQVDLSLPQTRQGLDDATFSGKVEKVLADRRAFLVAVEFTPGSRKELVGRRLWFYAVPETLWQRGDVAVAGRDGFGELAPGMHVDVLAKENVALAVHYVPEAGPGAGESVK
jgi:predicted small lipoprotein YifL